MPKTLTTLNDFQSYIRGVAGRALHHAPNVDAVFLALAGAVLLFKDRGTDLECRGYRGNTGNVLFITIHGKRYVFGYNHKKESVEIREDTGRGRVLASFTNASSLRKIVKLFRGL